MTVVVPAHNEASVIADNLRAILGDSGDNGIEIVVAANGCIDDTASVARSVSPRVTVIEIAEGSKIAALNAADRLVETFPVAYVDADVTVSGEALLALADAFDGNPDIMAGAPTLRVDLSRSDWLVKQYYRVWELSEYRRQAHIGSGLYMITERGRRRFAEFPPVIADDLFVLRLFQPHERLVLPEHEFTVSAPATFRAHVKRSTRIAAGNLELAELDSVASAPSGTRALLRRLARKPDLWPAFPVYVVGHLLPRLRASRSRRLGTPVAWNRDDTTRRYS